MTDINREAVERLAASYGECEPRTTATLRALCNARDEAERERDIARAAVQALADGTAYAGLERERDAAIARAEAAEKDRDRLDLIASEYLDVNAFAMPTPGGDDADVGWRCTQTRQSMSGERVISVGEVFRDDVRAAIDAARAALAKEGGNET